VADPRRFDWLFRPQERDEDLPLSAEARFAEAFAQLPADERSALALSEIGGLEPDEIAERLGTGEDAAAALVARARASLRAALAQPGRRLLGLLGPLQQAAHSGAGGPAARAAGAAVLAAVGIGATFESGRVAAPETLAPPRAEQGLSVHAPQPARAVALASAPDARAAATGIPAATARTEVPGAAATRARPPQRPAPAAAPAAIPTPAPAPAAASPGQVDGPPRLELVGVPPVAGRQVRPDDVRRAVLHLPHVAELVRDEVVRRVRAAEQDRAHERVAVVAAEAGEAEEPGRVHDAHPLDPDGPRVEVEPVEAVLRADEPRVRIPLTTAG
jgi:hypothetical protein